MASEITKKEEKDDLPQVTEQSDEEHKEEVSEHRRPSLRHPTVEYTVNDHEEEEEESEDESEEAKEEAREEFKSDANSSVRMSKVEVLNKNPKNSSSEVSSLPPITQDDSVRILPHFHKHDLHKMTVYDKPSYWICGGYFTEIGCLSSFNCNFKNIDFEFPHYQCHSCEFQVCLECVDYYSQSIEKARFLHRTYQPSFHPHPVKLDLGSESKSWL